MLSSHCFGQMAITVLHNSAVTTYVFRNLGWVSRISLYYVKVDINCIQNIEIYGYVYAIGTSR